MQDKVSEQAAERESAPPCTIGWLAGVTDGVPWIGLCRMVGADVEAEQLRCIVEDDAPLQALMYAIDDALMYVGDPEDPATAIDPIPAEVLAVLGQPLYTAPLQLEAEVVGAPTGGPCWQIIDASDESTWHDLTAVTRCEKPGCEVRRDYINGCTVLVSAAYRDGYAHVASDEIVSVRIPAGDV